MPTVDAVVECPVHRSFRVEQVAGMFDLAVQKKARQEFHVELPGLNEEWQIGAIVGPSGSGKSTVARQALGKWLYRPRSWPKDRAVIDGFGERSVKQITPVLTSVGFSSPPAWLKPYGVLSNGERFRCDLARALLDKRPVVAYDEFTSVVDRTVAKIGSAAVAKAIRKGRIARRFVAITCHYDVIEWLTPDWVLDMASGRLARGSLQQRSERPEIRLEVAPVHRSAWSLFARHHYLSGSISLGARCFCAFWGEEPCALVAWTQYMTRGRRLGDMRIHRLVVLPDFQGVGIGHRLGEFTASIWKGLGGRAFLVSSHPAVLHHCSRSPVWRRHRLGMTSPAGHTGKFAQSSPTGRYELTSTRRITAGFQYLGPAMDRAEAEQLAAARPDVFVKRDSVARVEALVRRYPGATASLLARLSGTSTAAVRHALSELVEGGDVQQAGRGGAGDPHAFYPVDSPPAPQ